MAYGFDAGYVAAMERTCVWTMGSNRDGVFYRTQCGVHHVSEGMVYHPRSDSYEMENVAVSPKHCEHCGGKIKVKEGA